MHMDKPALALAATLLLCGCGNSGDGPQDPSHPSPPASNQALPQQAPAQLGDGGYSNIASAKSAVETGGFVVVNEAIPAAIFDIRYHSSNNFVGTPVEGYEAPLCLLSEAAAAALAKAQREAAGQGRQLKVFDCYRPQRAVDHFVRWVEDLTDQRMKNAYYPEEDKSQLIEKGYIADRSGHSRGSTLDLTLANAADSSELDMGTPYDYFDTRSNTADPRISERQMANRLLLKNLMERHGFVNYDKEWWHYTLADEPYPDTYFDFPVAE